MLSPPGRFSITTGLPQRVESFSWIRRAPMSAPAPGPNGMTNRTGRCGQFCASARGAAAKSAQPARTAATRPRIVIGRMAIPPRCSLVPKAPAPPFGTQRVALARRLVDGGDLGALILDRGSEFLGRAAARHRTDGDHARTERRIGHDRRHVSDDALPDIAGHVAPAIDA